MKAAVFVSGILLAAAPALGQSSPEDNDKRPVQAHHYELTPLEPKADFASTLKLQPGYRASVWASGLKNSPSHFAGTQGCVRRPVGEHREGHASGLVDGAA